MRLGNRLSEIDLVLLFLLFGEDAQVGNPIPAGEGVALAGGSRGLAHHAVRVGEALLNFLTVKELAAIGNIQNVGLVLYFILSPLSEHRNGLTSNRLVEIDLVGSLLLVGVAGVVSVPVPTSEGVAIAGGRRSIDASVLVCLNGYSSAAIGELSTICRKQKLGLGRLLRSSSLAILIGVIGQCYCRHTTKSKRQAQACRNCFLRTQILHLFSFSHCIRPRLYASD